MSKINKRKIINDPIYGFIAIPSDLIFDLIEHPFFQRLRRIKQLGLTNLVYPGALHTRFHHAIGAMHLMGEAIEVLRFKGVEISAEEEEAVLIAILLHDIGHGPFSHALENSIVENIKHEEISQLFLQDLNQLFEGRLSLAIKVFGNEYPKQFLYQLISGQLDVDRLDYLKRDSFYTGVSEGVINSDRILKMINVVDNQIVIELKGIYSIEKFIVARRLMYWQVYLHKTVISAENLLVKILQRAKTLAQAGHSLFGTPSLLYFLQNNIAMADFMGNRKVLGYFANLDDNDIMTSIKVWMDHPDIILSTLCTNLIHRKLYHVDLKNEPIDPLEMARLKHLYAQQLGIGIADTDYFIFTGSVENDAYRTDSVNINILNKDGNIYDFTEISDQYNPSTFNKKIIKHFFCYPKSLRTKVN